MNKGFWEKLEKPIMALAPLADVTDPAFRRLIAKYGKPDVMFTEFVSADGLLSEGREVLLKDLLYSEEERPIVAQIFSSNTENIEKASRLIAELGFDGVDINMGCPDRNVEKQGAGACLIKNKKEAQEIIRAAKRGAGNLPVSVKTRTGYHKDEIDTWVGALLEVEPVAITIHARTRKDMSKVPARWENVKEAVLLARGTETLILGNGDVRDLVHARELAKETGADGIMLGRAIFGNPFLFANSACAECNCGIEHPAPTLRSKSMEKVIKIGKVNSNATQSRDSAERSECGAPVKFHKVGAGVGSFYFPTVEERLRVMVEHTKLFEELLPHKNFAVMKKHYKAYVNDFPGAKELRMELMETRSANEVEERVAHFLRTKQDKT